jgi:hypothetical protein
VNWRIIVDRIRRVVGLLAVGAGAGRRARASEVGRANLARAVDGRRAPRLEGARPCLDAGRRRERA